MTDVLADEGAKTAADIGATFLGHDVTDPAAWAAVVDRVLADHERLDVLVNNAGILHWATMTNTPLDVWNRSGRREPDRGLPRHAGRGAGPMMAQRSGSIINISSIGGMRGSGPVLGVRRDEMGGARDDQGRRAGAPVPTVCA